MPRHIPSPPSRVSISPAFVYQPPPSLHEIGSATAGNQRTHMVSATQRFHADASIGIEVLPEQSSCFPPVVIVGNAQEHIGHNANSNIEYGLGDSFANFLISQSRQPFMPDSAPFSQRLVHPEPPPQHPTTHFSCKKTLIQQQQYPPYSRSTVTDGTRRDETLQVKVNEFGADCTHGRGMAASEAPYPREDVFNGFS